MNFDWYRSNRGTAIFYKVPMAFLDEFRLKYPGKYKIRYRGPRKGDARGRLTRQAGCLKSRAVYFSAYIY